MGFPGMGLSLSWPTGTLSGRKRLCPAICPCRRTILEQQQWESCCLQDMALAMEQDHARNENEAVLNFQSARDDIKNKAREHKGASRGF